MHNGWTRNRIDTPSVPHEIENFRAWAIIKGSGQLAGVRLCRCTKVLPCHIHNSPHYVGPQCAQRGNATYLRERLFNALTFQILNYDTTRARTVLRVLYLHLKFGALRAHTVQSAKPVAPPEEFKVEKSPLVTVTEFEVGETLADLCDSLQTTSITYR